MSSGVVVLPSFSWPAHRMFWLISVCAGLLLVFITPPFQVPDEPAHFFRAYQIATGTLVAIQRDDGTGGFLPHQLVETNQVLVDSIPFQPTHKQTVGNIWKYLIAPREPEQSEFVVFSNTAVYSPIAYVPQVIGITLGRILGVSPLALMYLGRLGTMMFYTLAVSTATRVTPIFKWVFVLLGLAPMALFQMASLSADGVTNALSFLFIALVLQAAFGTQKRVEPKQVFVLAALGVLLALSKHTFVLIVPLCLIIPTHRFDLLRSYIFGCACIIGFSVAVAGVWYFKVHAITIQYIPGTDQQAQLQFVRTRPLFVLGVILKDFFEHGTIYASQYIGLLGWMDTHLPEWFLDSYWIMLCVTAWISMQQRIGFSFWSRVLVGVILFGNIGLISLLLFITWVPVGQGFIQGLQGRHFIPLGPLLFLLVYRYHAYQKIEIQQWGWFVLDYSLISVGITLVTLIKRYYIH